MMSLLARWSQSPFLIAFRLSGGGGDAGSPSSHSAHVKAVILLGPQQAGDSPAEKAALAGDRSAGMAAAKNSSASRSRLRSVRSKAVPNMSPAGASSASRSEMDCVAPGGTDKTVPRCRLGACSAPGLPFVRPSITWSLMPSLT